MLARGLSCSPVSRCLAGLRWVALLCSNSRAATPEQGCSPAGPGWQRWSGLGRGGQRPRQIRPLGFSFPSRYWDREPARQRVLV